MKKEMEGVREMGKKECRRNWKSENEKMGERGEKNERGIEKEKMKEKCK